MTNYRLPIVDSDDGSWGTRLNQFISKEHYNDNGIGDIGDPASGGHQTVTLRAGLGGTTNPAPLTFTSGSLISSASSVAGSIEFLSGRFYLTATNGAPQKVIATYADDGVNGATGDIYYRDTSANFTRIPIGSTNDVLTVISGAPSWESPNPAGFVTSTIGVTVDGGGSVITTGSKGYRNIQEDCTITGWTLVGKEAGSCVVGVRRCDYTSFPTTTNIAGTEKPTLSSAQKNQDSALSTWGVSLTAGDILEFVVESASTVTRISLFINISK
jgi:hypothetical protein